MAAKRAVPPEPDRLFALIEPLLAAESVEALLESAKRALESLTQAYATSIFITDGASVVREAWQPEDVAPLARPVRALVQTARRPHPHARPRAPEVRGGREPERRLHLRHRRNPHHQVGQPRDRLALSRRRERLELGRPDLRRPVRTLRE